MSSGPNWKSGKKVFFILKTIDKICFFNRRGSTANRKMPKGKLPGLTLCMGGGSNEPGNGEAVCVWSSLIKEGKAKQRILVGQRSIKGAVSTG